MPQCRCSSSPVEELVAEVEAVVEGEESFWEVGAVLES